MINFIINSKNCFNFKHEFSLRLSISVYPSKIDLLIFFGKINVDLFEYIHINLYPFNIYIILVLIYI